MGAPAGWEEEVDMRALILALLLALAAVVVHDTVAPDRWTTAGRLWA